MIYEDDKVGNNDLRISVDSTSGYYHVTLSDADDGDVIVVNEDDVVSLRNRLNDVIAEGGLS